MIHHGLKFCRSILKACVALNTGEFIFILISHMIHWLYFGGCDTEWNAQWRRYKVKLKDYILVFMIAFLSIFLLLLDTRGFWNVFVSNRTSPMDQRPWNDEQNGNYFSFHFIEQTSAQHLMILIWFLVGNILKPSCVL